MQGRDPSLILFSYFISLPSLLFSPGKTRYIVIRYLRFFFFFFFFISLSALALSLDLCVYPSNPPLSYIYVYIILSISYFFSVSLSSPYSLFLFFSFDLVFSMSPINTEGIALIIYPQILLCSTVAIKFIYIFINKISGRMSIIIQ